MSTKRKLAGIATVYLCLVMFVGVRLIPTRVIEIKIDPPQERTKVEIISSVAQAKGIEPNHLYGIATQESSFGKFLKGDDGCSLGMFHINSCVHQVRGIIGDLEKETEWVANQLLALGYRIDSRKAIAAYNRPADPNWDYADKVEKRIAEIEKFIGNK